MVVLAFFITISIIISYIDLKDGIILDKVILPSFVLLVFLKYLDGSLKFQDFISVAVVLCVFIIPIALNMAFGGGDLRYGAFGAIFVGLESLGYFIILSGLLHMILLFLLHKKSFPFAPAMSCAALGAYIIGNI